MKGINIGELMMLGLRFDLVGLAMGFFSERTHQVLSLENDTSFFLKKFSPIKINKNTMSVSDSSVSSTPSSPSSPSYSSVSLLDVGRSSVTKLREVDLLEHRQKQNLVSSRGREAIKKAVADIASEEQRLSRDIAMLKEQYKKAVDVVRNNEKNYKKSEAQMIQKNKFWRKDCEIQIEKLRIECETKLADLDSQKEDCQREYTRKINELNEALRLQLEKFEQYLVTKREAFTLDCYKNDCDRATAIREKLEQSQQDLNQCRSLLTSYQNRFGANIGSFAQVLAAKNKEKESLQRSLGISSSS